MEWVYELLIFIPRCFAQCIFASCVSHHNGIFPSPSMPGLERSIHHRGATTMQFDAIIIMCLSLETSLAILTWPLKKFQKTLLHSAHIWPKMMMFCEKEICRLHTQKKILEIDKRTFLLWHWKKMQFFSEPRSKLCTESRELSFLLTFVVQKK